MQIWKNTYFLAGFVAHTRFMNFLRIYKFIFLGSCRRPIFTIKTSTYHFCKLSLVKIPCSAHGTQSGLSGSNSDSEPQRVLIEENTGSHGVNPSEGSQEYEQGNVQPFQNPRTFKGSNSLLILYEFINY